MIHIQKRISIPSIHNKIKILLIPLLLTSLFSTNANALTGPQQLACEVLLCLSASAV